MGKVNFVASGLGSTLLDYTCSDPFDKKTWDELLNSRKIKRFDWFEGFFSKCARPFDIKFNRSLNIQIWNLRFKSPDYEQKEIP